MPITYRTMQPGEERSAIQMVRRVFDAAVAPLFAEEGVSESTSTPPKRHLSGGQQVTSLYSLPLTVTGLLA